jgi:hypothetical protein
MLWSPVITWPSGLHVNGELGRFQLEVDNIEIMQHLLAVKYFCCYRHGICKRDYRYGLILRICWNFRYDLFVMKNCLSYWHQDIETQISYVVRTTHF